MGSKSKRRQDEKSHPSLYDWGELLVKLLTAMAAIIAALNR